MPELPPVTSTLLPWSPRTRSSSVGRAIRISRCGRSHRYTRQGPCHTAPTMSDTVQPGPGNVTRIGGSVYGQVISGDNNLQYQVRVEEGGIVNLGPRVDPRALPLPVVLRPRDFPSLVGRERELDVALAAIAAGAPVEVQGAAKTGKTVLLRYLANRELPPSVPDGVVYLEVDGVPPADVLQSLFEAFHETDGAYKPTELRIRRAFQQTRALLLLDDATFDERAITRLLNALPRCVVVLTCLRRRFSADGAAIALGGLPAAAAMAVVERVLGRPLTGAEPLAAAELWHAVDGAPGWLALAAAQVAQGASTFEALAERLRSATPAEALAAEVAASLTAEQQRAVALLAAVGGPLAAPHLGALTGIADVEAAMEPLASRQLVTTHSPSYSLATGLRPRPGTETVDAASLRQAALEHFVAHAEANRHRPDRLAGDLDVCLGLLRWAVEQERWGSVVRLGRAIDGALALTRRWGAWEEALLAVRRVAGNLGDRGAEAWALHQLGTRALCLDERADAHDLLTRALELRELLGDAAGAAATRHNLAFVVAPVAAAAGDRWIPQQARRRPRSRLGLVAVVAVLALLAALSVGSVLVLGGGAGSPPVTTTTPVGPGIAVPRRLDFGVVPVGQAQSSVATVRSTGTAPLRVTGVELRGAAAADYQARPGDGCASIDPGGRCGIEVTFTPRVVGPRTATLVVHQNLPRPASTVTLSGTGGGFVLTVEGVDGAGRVRSQPAGIDCQATCSASFAPGALVTLSVADTDPVPVWDGPCTDRSSAAGSRSCTVRMDADTTITYRRPAPIG